AWRRSLSGRTPFRFSPGRLRQRTVSFTWSASMRVQASSISCGAEFLPAESWQFVSKNGARAEAPEFGKRNACMSNQSCAHTKADLPQRTPRLRIAPLQTDSIGTEDFQPNRSHCE